MYGKLRDIHDEEEVEFESGMGEKNIAILELKKW